MGSMSMFMLVVLIFTMVTSHSVIKKQKKPKPASIECCTFCVENSRLNETTSPVSLIPSLSL